MKPTTKTRTLTVAALMLLLGAHAAYSSMDVPFHTNTTKADAIKSDTIKSDTTKADTTVSKKDSVPDMPKKKRNMFLICEWALVALLLIILIPAGVI